MTIEHCPECSVQNNKEAICQPRGARSELFIMMEIERIESGMARINQEEIFSSTGRIFN